MKTFTWFVACCGVLLLVTSAAAQSPPADAAQLDAKVKQLTAQIERLQSEVDSLRAKSEPKLTTAVYQMDDLVTREPRMADGKDGKVDFEPWMFLIQRCIAPGSWQKNAGLGNISAFQTNLSLVANQTPEVHRELAIFFDEIRRHKQELEAMGLEVKISPKESLEDFGFFMSLGR